MNNNNYKGFSYIGAFFLLIGLALVGLFLSAMIGGMLLQKTPGTEIVEAFNDAKNAPTIRLIQAISLVFSMFLPTIIVARLLSPRPFHLIGFDTHVNIKQVLLVILVLFTSLFIASAFGNLNKELPISAELKKYYDQLESDYSGQVEMMLDLKGTGGYLLSMVLMAFLPAVCEEVLFRGGLQNFLTKYTNRPVVSIIIVSLIFSFVHFSFYGFLARVFLGLMLGFIYQLSGKLWLSILAHFLNNAMVVTTAFVMARQGSDFEDIMKQDLPTVYWGFLAIPFFILFLIQLKKVSGPGNLEEEEPTKQTQNI